jgi:hypothetical protein
MDYVKYSMKHKDNLNVTRFKGNLIRIIDEVYAIRIEKLTPCTTADEQTRLFLLMDTYNPHHYSDIKRTSDADRAWLRENYPGIYEIVEHYANNNLYTLDLHLNNVMRRGSTIVLVDAIC